MIRAFDPPEGLKVRALFDAFYLSPLVTKARKTRGFTWLSVAVNSHRTKPLWPTTLSRARQRNQLVQ